jgi:hypothetical protein
MYSPNGGLGYDFLIIKIKVLKRLPARYLRLEDCTHADRPCSSVKREKVRLFAAFRAING